jgi:tRNA/tmRNA/rRNA uracil-C5-methylase (TrmA/RlmC/RlmD family)
VLVDDIITIEATELVAGGDALARVDGFPVFASNVFPGDVARVRLVEVKKGFAKADLVELVKPSEQRRLAPCPVADECGGCDWTALRLDRQLEAKRRILSESLRRIGKLDVATLPEIRIHPSPLNYRLRSRLHRDGEAVGFYAMRSNRVVPLARECEVVGVETARVAPEGEVWEVDGMLLGGEQELTLTVDAFTYRLHTRAFFQVNRHLLGTMLRLVTAHAAQTVNRQHAVDLYAGVGFFTLPMAKLFDRVTMIEGSPLSARYARMNVPWNVKVVEAPVEQHVPRLGKANFVFLDPPRAGARRDVIAAVAEKTQERIAYLSCDPVTFARDSNVLLAAGWKLDSLDLLDLFPNTHHVETLGSFVR